MPRRSGSRFRRPSSTCIAYLAWHANAKTVRSGKREIRPGSLGQVEFIFRRKYPRYHYFGRRRLLRFSEFMSWTRSASPGTVWNTLYRGNI